MITEVTSEEPENGVILSWSPQMIKTGTDAGMVAHRVYKVQKSHVVKIRKKASEKSTFSVYILNWFRLLVLNSVRIGPQQLL